MVSNGYSPPEVDRIGLWVYDTKIPIYPIFYLLKGDHIPWVKAPRSMKGGVRLGGWGCSPFSAFFPTWTPKVCKIMAFWATFRGLGLLFYILLGFR